VNTRTLSEINALEENMKRVKPILSIVVVVIIILIVGFWSGYRLDGLGAARANSFVPKDAKLIDHIDYDWGGVYIFDSPKKPITAISIKKYGLFWSSKISVYYYHNDDPIKTIGGVSLANPREQATVVCVLVNDPDVSYLEVGPQGSRLRKEASIDKPITFSWDAPYLWNELNPQAFNKNGELIYEYRYARTNFIKAEDLRWYSTREK
jgi:hypothetical protein